MPYRRLPKTDLARMRALENAVCKDGTYHEGKIVITYHSAQEARFLLGRFKRAHAQYMQSYEMQAKASKKYRSAVKTARTYLSHFIQVLNMCFIRKELKKEYRAMYELQADTNTGPDLSLESSLLEWGNKIITGETERIKKGGIPIYNPTIAKVKVHFDIFVEAYHSQKTLQQNTARHLDALSAMRPEADTLILSIWNQVEAVYDGEPINQKIEKTSSFGVVYYYRPGEQLLQKMNKLQQKICFDD